MHGLMSINKYQRAIGRSCAGVGEFGEYLMANEVETIRNLFKQITECRDQEYSLKEKLREIVTMNPSSELLSAICADRELDDRLVSEIADYSCRIKLPRGSIALALCEAIDKYRRKLTVA
jgi:hypothetical protein